MVVSELFHFASKRLEQRRIVSKGHARSFSASKVFGTVTPTPLLIEAAVSSREHENQSENWISEARHRLAKRRGKKPKTKAGQIWALWPEIKGAIEDGQTMESIRTWLEDDIGVVVSADSLRSYVRRCRGKEITRPERDRPTELIRVSNGPLRSEPGPQTPHKTNLTDDPMANAREALNKARFDIRKAHNDGDPSGRKLI